MPESPSAERPAGQADGRYSQATNPMPQPVPAGER